MSGLRRVVVTGMGMCTPLGTGVRSVWRKLLNGQSGITNLPKTPEFENLPSQVIGMVPRGKEPGKFNEEDYALLPLRKNMNLSSLFALRAADEALEDAKWKPQTEEEAARTGVSVGCPIAAADIGDLIPEADAIAKAGEYHKLSPYLVTLLLTSMPTAHISMKFNLQGPNHSVTTACATGLHSIGDAACMIARGAADVMVAGGVEACVNPLPLALLSRIGALSTKCNSEPEKASRPFHAERDGFVLSEGAGVVVIEDLEHAQQRGATIYAEILGYGMSSDAYHVVRPLESGRGVQQCMKAAIKDAGITPEAVGHVNAHATSTPLGDRAETKAIKGVFGDHAYNLFVSATKGATGHMLGAAGAVETMFTALAVKEGIVPPTLNLTDPEPGLDLNYVPNQVLKWRSKDRRIAVTNSFGFGGTNSSLCIAEV